MLDTREVESHLTTLCLFVLEMLDKLDEWTRYLATWHLIREHTSCSLTYQRAARVAHGPRLTPFILAEHGVVMRVHFLYHSLSDLAEEMPGIASSLEHAGVRAVLALARPDCT